MSKHPKQDPDPKKFVRGGKAGRGPGRVKGQLRLFTLKQDSSGRGEGTATADKPRGMALVSERQDFDCGCAWVKAGGNWWHVVACPQHQMDMLPKTEPIMITRRSP